MEGPDSLLGSCSVHGKEKAKAGAFPPEAVIILEEAILWDLKLFNYSI